MAQTHALIIAESFRESDPAKVLRKVNDHIFRINRSGLFTTVIYGVVNSSNRTFSFARAGHEIPILKTPGNLPSLIPHDIGQPLGLLEEPIFDEQEIDLDQNFSLLLYTDGVLDIRGDKDEQFGIERLTKRFNQVGDKSALTVCDYIWDDLAAFQGVNAPYDDVTMIVIRSAG
jgi:sigma-B regulation protein RsbU (phosphoserine phosphatase)